MIFVKQRLKFALITIASIITISSLIFFYTIDEKNADEDSLTESETEISIGTLQDKQMRSAQTGNIYANKILSECGIDFNCTFKNMKDLAKEENQKIVLATFSDIVSVYQQVGIACHKPGHHLGVFLYAQTGNLSQSLSIAQITCGGAISHGVMENYFKTEIFLNETELEDIDILNICKKLEDNPYSQIRMQCAHGVGHGLGIGYDYDVFNAVKRCDGFETALTQNACDKGVFMENVVEYLEKQGGNFDTNDNLYPCNEVDEKYANACYQYQASYLLTQAMYHVDEVFQECNKIKPEKFVKNCYFGIGMQMTIFHFEDMEGLASVCMNGHPDYQAYCVAGAAYHVGEQKGSKQIIELCKLLPEKFKIDCYTSLGQWVHTLHSTIAEIEKDCSDAESIEYYKVCTNADPRGLVL